MIKEPDLNFIQETMASQCLHLRLKVISRQVNQIYDTFLRPFAIKSSQLTLLNLIAKAKEVTSPQICDWLKMDKSTLSRNLDRLKQQGWIVVNSSAEDNRVQIISITPAGQEKLKELFPLWLQAQQQAHDLLQESGVTALKAIYHRMN